MLSHGMKRPCCMVFWPYNTAHSTHAQLPSLPPSAQYCDRGSLADALAQRRLVGKDGRPHMVGVRVWHKAAGLLDKGFVAGQVQAICAACMGGHASSAWPCHTTCSPHPSPPHPIPPAPQVAVLLCLLDVASGMSYLHSLGIVHGGGAASRGGV